MLTRVDFYIFYARTISETVLKHFGMFLNDRFVPLIILATRSQANTLRYFGVGQTVPFPFPNPFTPHFLRQFSVVSSKQPEQSIATEGLRNCKHSDLLWILLFCVVEFCFLFYTDCILIFFCYITFVMKWSCARYGIVSNLARASLIWRYRTARHS